MTYDYLIIGLGNPGTKYENTRHNAGFAVLDALAENTWKSEHNALTQDAMFDEHPMLLAKPQTYMNKSGDAVQKLVHYYKVPTERIVVVHDDIDLPLGEVKVSQDRGAGGHRGVESIISTLGTKAFARVRIGVTPAEGKPGKDRVKNFVLRMFGEKEAKIYEVSIQKAVYAVELVVGESVERAMNEIN